MMGLLPQAMLEESKESHMCNPQPGFEPRTSFLSKSATD